MEYSFQHCTNLVNGIMSEYDTQEQTLFQQILKLMCVSSFLLCMKVFLHAKQILKLITSSLFAGR